MSDKAHKAISILFNCASASDTKNHFMENKDDKLLFKVPCNIPESKVYKKQFVLKILQFKLRTLELILQDVQNLAQLALWLQCLAQERF